MKDVIELREIKSKMDVLIKASGFLSALLAGIVALLAVIAVKL